MLFSCLPVRLSLVGGPSPARPIRLELLPAAGLVVIA